MILKSKENTKQGSQNMVICIPIDVQLLNCKDAFKEPILSLI